jgi:hypothetical protein
MQINKSHIGQYYMPDNAEDMLQELKCIYAELAIWYLPHEKLPELEMVKL